MMSHSKSHEPATTILITGCSSGIGLEAANLLKARGYQVLATARQQSDVNRLIEAGFEAFTLDLADEKSIEAALTWAESQAVGDLDALFNNGAYGQPGALEDLPTHALREQFEANVFGWHDLTRRVLARMRKQGHGRIVQNSSVLGFVCMPYRGAYNASKFAIEGLTDTLRLELMGSNIHISLLQPGPITSSFRKNALAKFHQHIPNWQNSVHAESYRQQLERLQRETEGKFTLPASAVVDCLIHALESPKPKARYRITRPTKIAALLKRVLPAKGLDRLLVKG